MAADRYQVIMGADSPLARDVFVNTLYFEDIGTSDLDGTAHDLAQIYQDFWFNSPREIRVKVYDVGVGPSGPPKGEAVINLGTTPASVIPREVAICLSFYAAPSTPRRRGRVYLPMPGSGLTLGVRPSTTVLEKATTLAGKFAALGGADVSWNVHSQTTGEDNEVTHAWCDDEWDTVRSRGLRPTTRSLVATGS